VVALAAAGAGAKHGPQRDHSAAIKRARRRVDEKSCRGEDAELNWRAVAMLLGLGRQCRSLLS
jgi:hypothetical protein